MIENNEMVAVHWFYGESETGKSFLAEKLANELGTYYKTTTTTDPFQFYQAEHTIILDELRPEIIPYSELLALFNPFSMGKITISSRYYNKTLSCKTIFITTPYDPLSFYYGYKLHNSDKGNQLFRRLSSVVKFDMDYIYKMEYDNKLEYYVEIDKKENHYSKLKQNHYSLDNIFDKIN
ncbi:MAG: hypothetical protein IJ763_04865 [Lachnospiraceae bacterium]|nr:hypothetical protein [Lachnospiraceae bacterium]